MADFTSGFWQWYIFILVVLSISGVLALVVWMAQGKFQPGEQAKAMGHVWDDDLQELNNPLPKWWLNLFYMTLIFAVIYLALYPGLGLYQGALKWSRIGQYETEIKQADAQYGPIYEKYRSVDVATLATNPDALKIGQRLFLNYCTNCHGADAHGNVGFPNLTDKDWLYGGAPDNIQQSIMNGRGGMMPAWGQVLGQEGVYNVATYVMSLSGRKVNEDAALAGKDIFAKTCVACHGPDAKGNPAMGAPNLTDNIWLYGGSQQAILKTISDGRQGRMPAHGEFLGEAKVHLLAAYVYSLSQDKK
jgi:cytochrome c oxidase cbb3-type subunit 3